jgi:dihydrofolate reductase
MDSGTFTFVTDGIESALGQARVAAGDKDVLIMGGATIAQQFVRAGLVDEIQLQLVPVLLGSGSRPFERLGSPPIAWTSPTVTVSGAVTHLRYGVMR